MRVCLLLGRLSSKNKPPCFGVRPTCFGHETKTGVVHILVIFQHRPMFSHINGKLLP